MWVLSLRRLSKNSTYLRRPLAYGVVFQQPPNADIRDSKSPHEGGAEPRCAVGSWLETGAYGMAPLHPATPSPSPVSRGMAGSTPFKGGLQKAAFLKKKVIFCRLAHVFAILLFVVPQPALADDSQAEAKQLFALGVQLYADGDAPGAVAAFEGAGATGWSSGMLHYNLGTAYLDLEHFGPAILHFERARRLMPGNEAITHNLRIARERAGVTVEAASALGLLNSRLSRMGGPILWLAFGLVLYISLTTIIGFRFWTRRDDTWSRRAITVLVPVTAAVLVAALSVWRIARTPEGIVLSEDAQLRASPSAEAASRATLQPGLRVHITEVRDGWQAVRLPRGVRGWLPLRAVERI